MTTTTVKTIGTGGDYSTIQAWFDAAPSDLTSSDVIWEGRLKNQEFTDASGRVLYAASKTTDATRYFHLTTDTGCSFIDNANKLTNALRYNSSNGAGIKKTTSYDGVALLDIRVNYFRFSKLQISSDDVQRAAVYNEYSYTGQFDKCIVESGNAPIYVGNYYKGTNTLFVTRGTYNSSPMFPAGGCEFNNCTFVVPSDITTVTTGLYIDTGGATFKNCAFFGANNSTLGSGGGYASATFTNCKTDCSSVPSGVTGSVTYSSCFETTTDTGHDFRLKSGSPLIDAGTTGSGIPSDDIVGTSRSTTDIGAWEYASGDGSTPKRNLLLRVG